MSPDTYPTDEEFSDADHLAAESEGWCIPDCDGSEDGRTQLQRLDEAEVFVNDEAAWRHVSEKARSGSGVHQRALAAIASHNPQEAERIALASGTAQNTGGADPSAAQFTKTEPDPSARKRAARTINMDD